MGLSTGCAPGWADEDPTRTVELIAPTRMEDGPRFASRDGVVSKVIE